RSGLSNTATTPTPRRRRYAPAHNASPPLLPAPTSRTTRRPATFPVRSANNRAAETDTPNAARRINVPSDTRRMSRCSATRTRSVVHMPRMNHPSHPTVAHEPTDPGAGQAKLSSSFYCLHMAAKPKHLFEELSHPGPHEVRRGDLALVGLPGVVFTPRQGLNLPAVVFGHGWMQPPGRYQDLLRHLASWGIVAAAPATHGGPL